MNASSPAPPRPQRAQRKNLAHCDRGDAFELQADQRGERFARGERELVRGLLRAPAAGFTLPSSVGEPLPLDLQASLEQAFDARLAAVRIHRDAPAQAAARAFGASAFASGVDVYFAAGTYDPVGSAGRSLIAHELTHVLQQTGRASSGGLLEARALHGEGEIQCAPPTGAGTTPAPLSEEEQAKLFDEMVKLHRGSDEPTGDTELETAIGRARTLLGGKLVKDSSGPAFATGFNKAADDGGELRRYRSIRARSFVVDCLKFLGFFKNAGAMLTEDKDFKLRTLGPVDDFSDFLEHDLAFGRPWIAAWLTHDVFKKLWPSAVLRGWRYFYLRPRFIVGIDPEIQRKLEGNIKEITDTRGKSPPAMRAEHYWMAWRLIGELDDERTLEQAQLRADLIARSTSKSLYETLAETLPLWKAEEDKKANDDTLPMHERALASGKIPFIDEAVTYWRKAFADYSGWIGKLNLIGDPAYIDKPALDLPDSSLVAAAASGLRAPFIKAVSAVFAVKHDAEERPVLPTPDEYQQRLDALARALTGSPFAMTKKGESASWVGHVETLAFKEATATAPDPARLAQFAIFPLIVNDVVSQTLSYDVAADQAAPHFDDVRRAHRVRLARWVTALARWLGWHEIVEATSDTLSDAESEAFTGGARLMLVTDWEVDERMPIVRMFDDFPGNRNTQILSDSPFTLSHLVEWFRYDYHQRLGETLKTLLRAEVSLSRDTRLDFKPLDQLRQTQKEVKASIAATAEAEHEIDKPGDLAIKVPQRFSVRQYEVLAPKDTRVDWEAMIREHPKTWMQLFRRNPRLIFPKRQELGVFAWALPRLDGLIALLHAIPSIARLIARQGGSEDAGWLGRLSPKVLDPDASEKEQAEEQAKVRLSDEDWKRLNETLLRWIKKLGEEEEQQLPDLWRRVIILRRRSLAMLLMPRIEHFAKYPYVSHGPWQEKEAALKVRLETPDFAINAMRAFESSARPMREARKSAATPEARAEAERIEREEMQQAVDVQLVLLTLTMAPALLKLTPSIIDANIKTGLYEFYQLTIDHVEDKDKFKALQAGIETNDEAASIVYAPDKLDIVVKGMKEFMTAIEEEVKKSQTEGGFRSEDGKSIRPNAEGLPRAIIASKKPGAEEEAAREWHLNMKLGDDGQLDPNTGDTYRLVDVYCEFRFHRQVGSPPVRNLRKGTGGPYAPARVIIRQGGEDVEYTDPHLPEIDLFKIRINDREIVVKANDLVWLTELDEIFLWRSFNIGMAKLTEGLHTFNDWMMTVVGLVVPQVAMAEFAVGMAQMLDNGEFDDMVKQLKDDPLAFAQHALQNLRDKLFESDRIWEYLLLGTTQHSPWAELRAYKPTRKPKVNPGSSSKFGRLVSALRSLGSRFGYGLERVRGYTQPPLRRAQGRIAMHPTLVWVLRRAANIVQAGFDLVDPKELAAARQADGPAHLVEFASALFGEQGSLDKELRERLGELFEGIQRIELPGQLVDLRAATEMIIGFVLDRFGKRGKILRMLLSVMPVPESWVEGGNTKGMTNALSFLAARIASTWWKESSLDPNKYWKEDLMPVIGTQFTKVRDELVDGLYTTTNKAMALLELKPMAPPDKSKLPQTKVEPEDLTNESEASIPPGQRRMGRPSLTGEGGTPLSAGTRRPYERQLGADLSHVRLHANAAAATRPIGADALTSGSHVFMRPGIAPGSTQGKRLLAHELTHVVQQTGPHAGSQAGYRSPTLGRPGLGLRMDAGREGVADQVAARIGSGRGVSPTLRASIGSAQGLQPSLGEEVAKSVIATLSTVKGTDDFTKRLEGGRDPEGLAQARALANQVFSMLKSGLGVEYAGFMKDASHDIPKLVRDYLRELTDKFPDLELKRIAELAQTPRSGKKSDEPDTELSPKSFVQLLANYLFAARHVAIKITHDAPVKKIQKIELFNINIGGIGGTAKLWDIAMTNSFGGNAAVTDRAKAQSEMRERLNALGPQPSVWASGKFRFADWLINDYVALLEQRAKGKVDDVPEVSKYTNPVATNESGLAVSTHGDLKSRGVSTYGRESHHTTQYLLAEFFGNDPEATQKAFPGDPKDFEGAGIGFQTGKDVVDTIDGSGSAPLKVKAMNEGSERGAAMPAILLSARCHQRGELHVLRESRWEDTPKGDKERKGTQTQGLAIENAFNSAISKEVLRPRDESTEHRENLRQYIAGHGPEAKTTYYAAALSTYKWMRDRMIPALESGLRSEELAYYRGIAARHYLAADGQKLQHDWDMQPDHLDRPFKRAEENNTTVMGGFNWKA